MKRSQLEHVIRAAAAVSGDDEIVVVGSQAILAQFPQATEKLLFSQEADVYPKNLPDRAIEIDGALGDGSQFHETYGYYAHGVAPETAQAPSGWEGRLVPVRVRVRPGSESEVTGWCLETHDLVLAKCAAGRERDWAFAREAVRSGLVSPTELLDRIGGLPLPKSDRKYIERMLRGVINQTKR